MIILACDTSTLLGSVALIQDEKILATEQSMRQGSHSEAINLFIESVLKKAGKSLEDIDLFATGIGPGSFTGIRICLNSIKTLAFSYNKPVYVMDSLANMALQIKYLGLLNKFENKSVISMVNAYKNMVYVSQQKITSNGILLTKPPEVLRVQNLENYLTEPALVCGDGYRTYEKYFSENFKKNLIRSELLSDEPHAKYMALEAFKNHQKSLHWSEILPLYLRLSEAEENLKGIKYQPLF